MCWIKEAREQNATAAENSLSRFGVSFGVRINSVRPFQAKWTSRWPVRCEDRVSFLDFCPQGFYERSLGCVS